MDELQASLDYDYVGEMQLSWVGALILMALPILFIISIGVVIGAVMF